MRARQLEVFCAIMREGSLTSASKTLNTSQPALSQLLRHAEQQLGFALFKRVRGRLVPTPEALEIYPEADRLFQDLEALRRRTNDLKTGRRGLVRMAASAPPAMSVVPTALTLFRAKHPEIVVRSQIAPLDTMIAMLMHGDVNLALCMSDEPSAGLNSEHLGKVGFVCLMPQTHALAGRETPIHFENLKDESLIAYRHATLPGRVLAQKAQRDGVIYRPEIEIDTSISALSFVQAGLGVAIVDALLPWQKFHGITAREFAPDLTLPISLLTRAERELSIAETLMQDNLRQACAGLLS
ncbi:LysR family transcriptional regulator [Arenicellales bacterium nBUS_48]